MTPPNDVDALDPAGAPEKPHPRSTAKLMTWFAPVLVLALLVFAFVVYSVLHHRSTLVHRLGPYAIECKQPRDGVQQYVEFSARGAKPRDGWYRFEVRDASAPADSPPLLLKDKHIETKWIPSGNELGHLPARIRWRISALDEHGVVVDSDETEAWLAR